MTVPTTIEATLTLLESEGFSFPAVWPPEAKIIQALDALEAEDNLEPLTGSRFDAFVGCAAMASEYEWHGIAPRASALLVSLEPRLE